MSNLTAGKVGRPHGLDGSFHVLNPVPRFLDLGQELVVDQKVVSITRRAGTDAKPIVRLSCCSTREDAKGLGGVILSIPESETPELGVDEWYEHELVGLVVVSGDERVGEVKRLLTLPSCDVLEVERASGQSLMMVPLIKDAVQLVDIEGGRIEIDLQFLGESSGNGV